VRGVVAELGSLRPDDVTVLDMEASIEHLTRGTVRDVEKLLIVTEPYFRSLETLGRTVPLARELGLADLYIIANKVRSERDEEAIREYSARLGVPVLGVVPFDEAIQEADRVNQALIDYVSDSPALDAIDEMVAALSAEIQRPRAASAADGG
jgi:CO dehydrogenase maturation factor